MDVLAPTLFCGVLVIFGFAVGIAVTRSDAPSLTECAKRHNVYACKLVAVPITDAIRTPPTGEEQ